MACPPYLSLKAEYLYVKFNDTGYFNPAPTVTGASFINNQVVRLGETSSGLA